MAASSRGFQLEFAELLDLSIDTNNGLPQTVCKKCKHWLECLEFATEERVKLARKSFTVLVPQSIVQQIDLQKPVGRHKKNIFSHIDCLNSGLLFILNCSEKQRSCSRA